MSNLEDATTKTEDLFFLKLFNFKIFNRIYSASNRIILMQIEIYDGNLFQHGHISTWVPKNNDTPLFHYQNSSTTSCISFSLINFSWSSILQKAPVLGKEFLSLKFALQNNFICVMPNVNISYNCIWNF